MRIRKRYVIPAVASVAVLALAGVAQAVTNNSSSLSLSPKTSFTPSKVSKTTYKSGTLFAHTHTDFAHPGDKAQGGFPKTVTLLFDNDFKFNTSGVPQCAGSFSSNTTLAQAYSACKSSLIGTGTASTAPNANLPGCVLAFNGKPSGGAPTIVLFTRVFPTSPADCSSPSTNSGGFTSVTISGTLTNAGVADYGKKLTVANLDQLSLSLDDFTAKIHKGNYVQGRCFDSNKTWNYRGTFAYSGTGQATDTVNATQTCTVG
jgi:hypothetical protein